LNGPVSEEPAGKRVFTAAAPISEYVLRAAGGNPAMAYGLYAGGLAAYLLATRAVATDPSARFGELARMAVVAVTVCLAFLEPLITPTGVLLIITAWAVAIAA
jgi:hypothetical protein